MAGSYTRRNAGGTFTNDSSTLKPTSAVFCTSTSALARVLIPTLASTPTSVPGLLERYKHKNLQRATKLTLESFVKG